MAETNNRGPTPYEVEGMYLSVAVAANPGQYRYFMEIYKDLSTYFNSRVTEILDMSILAGIKGSYVVKNDEPQYLASDDGSYVMNETTKKNPDGSATLKLSHTFNEDIPGRGSTIDFTIHGFPQDDSVKWVKIERHVFGYRMDEKLSNEAHTLVSLETGPMTPLPAVDIVNRYLGPIDETTPIDLMYENAHLAASQLEDAILPTMADYHGSVIKLYPDGMQIAHRHAISPWGRQQEYRESQLRDGNTTEVQIYFDRNKYLLALEAKWNKRDGGVISERRRLNILTEEREDGLPKISFLKYGPDLENPRKISPSLFP